ncbi:hypothetical protein SprV_0401546400 [Sparganum proliferum]
MTINWHQTLIHGFPKLSSPGTPQLLEQPFPPCSLEFSLTLRQQSGKLPKRKDRVVTRELKSQVGNRSFQLDKIFRKGHQRPSHTLAPAFSTTVPKADKLTGLGNSNTRISLSDAEEGNVDSPPLAAQAALGLLSRPEAIPPRRTVDIGDLPCQRPDGPPPLQLQDEVAEPNLQAITSQTTIGSHLTTSLEEMQNFDDNATVERKCDQIRRVTHSFALNVLGFASCQHQDWFDSKDEEVGDPFSENNRLLPVYADHKTDTNEATYFHYNSSNHVRGANEHSAHGSAPSDIFGHNVLPKQCPYIPSQEPFPPPRKLFQTSPKSTTITNGEETPDASSPITISITNDTSPLPTATKMITNTINGENTPTSCHQSQTPPLRPLLHLQWRLGPSLSQLRLHR